MILALTLNPGIDKVYAVDDFQIDRVFRPEAMTQTAGGKGLNVARVATLLGESVTAAGFIGGGTGSFIQKQIKQQGIVDGFTVIQGESRINIAIMDRVNHTSTEILEPGPEIAPIECQEFLADYTKLLSGCDLVVASGSLPKGLPVDFYRNLITLARQRGKRFILDTSGVSLLSAITAGPYMIKPNGEEYQKIFGTTLPVMNQVALKKAVLNLAERGVEYPCISLGKDGCVVKVASRIYRLYAPKLEVVNTVGSGDSFVAGCAVGFKRQLEAVEIFKLGMACGIANTQFFETGMVTVELVEKYRRSIQIEELC